MNLSPRFPTSGRLQLRVAVRDDGWHASSHAPRHLTYTATASGLPAMHRRGQQWGHISIHAALNGQSICSPHRADDR